MHQSLSLDEVLDLVLPLDPCDNTPKKRPGKAEWSLFPVEEKNRYEDISLTLVFKSGEDEIRITGIADAVCVEDGIYYVEEHILLDQMVSFARFRDRTLLRARFLALALAGTKKLTQVGTRLFVFAQGRVETEPCVLEKEELSRTISPYIQKVLSLSVLFQKPDVNVVFPHTQLREGQKKLIHGVWDAIKSGTKLFACAPTGIGKTLAVLYPALRALETGRAKKVFYASPKNTLKLQAAAAVESLQKLRGLRTLVLGAKMSLCPEEKEECESLGCPYMDGFGEKLPQALSFLATFSCITTKEILSAAKTFQICPFQLQLKIQPYCQVVIGDYNHIFDPNRALFAPSKDAILLIDEAHNLPTRIRESFSVHLSPQDLDPFFRNPVPAFQMLKEHLAPLSAIFVNVDKKRDESKEYFSFEAPASLAEKVSQVLPKVGFALHEGFGPLSREDRRILRDFYGKLKKFTLLFKAFDSDFATVYPPEGGVRIYLVNPREKIRSSADGWKSVTFFSATLLPKDYYFQLLSGGQEDSFLVLPSPFPRENLFVGICHLDVSYAQRFATAPKLCSIIRRATASKPGNYMVFLPSFEYLNLVSQEYKKRFFDHRILVQEKIMTGQKRKEFLRTFEENRKGTLIGFCVMGGIFSEGVDLKGDSLVGEIIVGTGFPPPSPEAEAECASYYKREMDGKSFAYTLPGWSRVLQAAGRVIRDENDRGFLILCDARYQGEDMLELFPESWDGAVHLERDAQLQQELERFWK